MHLWETPFVIHTALSVMVPLIGLAVVVLFHRKLEAGIGITICMPLLGLVPTLVYVDEAVTCIRIVNNWDKVQITDDLTLRVEVQPDITRKAIIFGAERTEVIQARQVASMQLNFAQARRLEAYLIKHNLTSITAKQHTTQAL